MVQRIQYKPANAPTPTIAKELRQSKLIVSLIEEELVRWREDAKAALAAVIGVKSWKSASTKKLHPVDRLTARFRCKRCDAGGHSRGWDAPSFDFSMACKHRCKAENGGWIKGPWCAENFTLDVKVSYMEVLRITVALTWTPPKIGLKCRPASSCTAWVRCRGCDVY
jgi:hypothetical protein